MNLTSIRPAEKQITNCGINTLIAFIKKGSVDIDPVNKIESSAPITTALTITGKKADSKGSFLTLTFLHIQDKTAAIKEANVPNRMSMAPKIFAPIKYPMVFESAQPNVTPTIACGEITGKSVSASAIRNCILPNEIHDNASVSAQ